MPPEGVTDVSGCAETVPTVLIVDDRRENLLALEALLDPLGVRVVRATSGREAVSRCVDEEFAVVILDVMMPDADGVETARMLKARGASRLTPIIFLTAAEADRRRVHDGYASGAVDYLFKPVDPDVLRAKVAAFVDLHRNRRAEHWRQRRRYEDQAAAAAEAAFREGEEQFRLLAQSVPTMVWTARADGRIDSLNAFGARYVGIESDRPSDVRWTDHVHPDDVGIARRKWARVVHEGIPFEMEVRLWCAQRGAYRRHIARAVPRRDAGASVVGWVGINTDVEDSKRAEEEAHEIQLTAEREARIASDDARAELARALDRIARLQALTAALSEAVTPAEVAKAVVVNGMAALHASAALVAAVDEHGPDGRPILRLITGEGYPQDVLAKWREIPLDTDIPLVRAMRTRKSIMIGDARRRVQDYPTLAATDPVFADALALPLIANGESIGVLGLSFAEPPNLSDDDRTLADAIARQCAQALQRAELFAAERRAHGEAEQARRRVEFLSEAGAALNQSLDYQATLQTLVDTAVPFLADCAVLDMLTPDGMLQRLALAHRDPSMQERLSASAALVSARPDPSHPARGAVLDGRSRLYTTVTDVDVERAADSPEHLAILRSIGITSLMAIPLRARDRTLGVLILSRTTTQRYTASDLQLAEDLSRRAALAIDTALLYEEAQAANHAKASFLAAISHDLRQPLNASLGFLEIALMGIRGEVAPALREDLERVRRNQQHLLALINDVLSFARVEAGQLVVRREVVPLREILDGLPSLVSPQADAQGVTLQIAECPSSVAVLADRDRVVQVFTNLLTNAIKATPAGGTVVLDVQHGGDFVLGHVRDTGVGIPAELCEQIFEPFMQVARSLNQPQSGIGLGLSISRNLTRAMGGDLTVDSVVGKGSVFTVRLPGAALGTPSAGLPSVHGIPTVA